MEMYGERLRLRRKARGLSQRQLGELIGCTGKTISNHEKSGRGPVSEVVKMISAVLGEF